MSDADIKSNLGWIYSDAGIPDKAEEYFRQALSLEPGDSAKLNDLGWLIIEKNRNINEGLELIDKALTLCHEIDPDNYSYLHTKGWGLYKKGEYKEALECLSKCWELKPMYDHQLYLHLEEVKKVLANQK